MLNKELLDYLKLVSDSVKVSYMEYIYEISIKDKSFCVQVAESKYIHEEYDFKIIKRDNSEYVITVCGIVVIVPEKGLIPYTEAFLLLYPEISEKHYQEIALINKCKNILLKNKNKDVDALETELDLYKRYIKYYKKLAGERYAKLQGITDSRNYFKYKYNTVKVQLTKLLNKTL